MALSDATPEQSEQYHRERRMEKEHRDRQVKEAVAKAIASLKKDMDRRIEMCASLVEDAVANERERCAKVCEELVEEQTRKFKEYTSKALYRESGVTDCFRMAYRHAAAKIRGDTE